ncbi:MAG TPA: acyl-ACP--UDP-N-acetylglucosamine O-acyltransferase [Bacteroidia bacterium]|nr:acyl-ACP--UDP-N-acetylglucosamine O-acyltransferase [Bacteroidota bacterium]MBL7947784.1 acyl-ACP--UDP-N-acetylglucosamine O-acyltransferase [Bacteroidia bacterium]HRI40152.1 acyl-ACP--UDP-N-acetylglucosamine O-acyltransferase [Bacteroidia bacterium]HRS39481.1 acyl-ACP--UDP-N-acetylglucosamine O-acyltransferase [Bacteroidia bacterium]HRU62042.1 acyl-ACP--UDP-N-acetylglucosamine O-acyltransferase [Bacteroidia bacterium]
MQALNWIHPEAKIGKDVKIDPFTVIHEDVEIGEGTWIGSNVTIFPGARIGKHVRIFPGAVISAVPQDLKFAGEKTTAEIGDHTTIREYVTINRGTTAAGKTVVGAHNLLMAYVHIAHDCFVGDHCILANGVTLAGHIEIHDYAIIGGLSAIHQFVQIGSHVMISGGSLVRKDVPPFVKAAHEPLAYVGVNALGLRRRGFSNDQIAQIQEIYRKVFVSGLNITHAIEAVEQDIPASAERKLILDFIRKSSRGLMKGYAAQSDE